MDERPRLEVGFIAKIESMFRYYRNEHFLLWKREMRQYSPHFPYLEHFVNYTLASALLRCFSARSRSLLFKIFLRIRTDFGVISQYSSSFKYSNACSKDIHTRSFHFYGFFFVRGTDVVYLLFLYRC